MKTRIIFGIAALISIVTVGYYFIFHDRLTQKIIVAIDAPMLNKRIFDPSDMDAARLYFEETPNSRLRLRESYYDFSPEDSIRGFAQGINDRVQFFITTQPSSMLIHSAYLFKNSKALVINTSATSPRLSAKDDYMLRIIPDGEVEQREIAKFIDQIPGSRLLVLQDADNAAYTDPAYAFFKDEIEQHGRWHITHHRFVFNKFDPASLRPVVEKPYDALYLLAGEFQQSTGNIAQLFHHHHPQAPIILTPWARSDAIFEAAGPAIEQMVLLGHHRGQADDPAVADYLQRFRQRFGYQPMAMALHVRQALELLEQAVAAGHDTPETARAFLLSKPSIETSLGSITFDQFGDVATPLFAIQDLSKELSPP